MIDYTNFNASELAQDEDFINWVKYPDRNSALNVYLNSWIAQNPAKKEIVEEAKLLICAVVGEKQYAITEERKHELWARIDETVSVNSTTKPPKRVSRILSWYSVAATISLIVLLGVWQSQRNDDEFFGGSKHGLSYSAGNELIKFSNDGDKAYTLKLNDGSRITLQPNSEVRYPENFLANRRDVYLSGEAFFEVSRDPKRPFSVYANELVTQVLGTSFNIRAYKKESNITVAVKTGKVSVFKESDEDGIGQKPDAAFLTRNQQIVFLREESKMVKSLVDEPEMLIEKVKEQSFQFTDEPIDSVFSLFEQAYGVDIVYDKEVMSGCYLNASLQDESFHDQLRLICKGINATYEVLDAHIIISGNGCH
jgi:transmembrane sensor